MRTGPGHTLVKTGCAASAGQTELVSPLSCADEVEDDDDDEDEEDYMKPDSEYSPSSTGEAQQAPIDQPRRVLPVVLKLLGLFYLHFLLC